MPRRLHLKAGLGSRGGARGLPAFCAALVLGCALALAQAHAQQSTAEVRGFTRSPKNHGHLVLRTTAGLVRSFDAGKGWHWICAAAVGVGEGIADAPLMVTQTGTMMLLPPTGSAVRSVDKGCSWTISEGALDGQRGVDLKFDPTDGMRIVVLTSTLAGTDADGGAASFDNLLFETRDDGASFTLVATLASDFEAETFAFAPGDPAHLYVSGTASANPGTAILERSDDGGAHFVRATSPLPPNTGSFRIAAIAPDASEMLWLRAAARDDREGLFPAHLLFTSNKGTSYVLLASTTQGMLGLSLSPDGKQLAFGGPSDGLLLGPSDGSRPFEKVSDVGVRCLEWSNPSELFVCASQSKDAFSLGTLAAPIVLEFDAGTLLLPHVLRADSLYRQEDTCPATCADGTPFARTCQTAWSTVRPLLGASGELCTVPWASGEPSDDDTEDVVPDGGEAGNLDAGAPAASDFNEWGCIFCAVGHQRRPAGLALWATGAALLWWRRRRRPSSFELIDTNAAPIDQEE